MLRLCGPHSSQDLSGRRSYNFYPHKFWSFSYFDTLQDGFDTVSDKVLKMPNFSLQELWHGFYSTASVSGKSLTTCRFCNVVECACRTCLCRQLNVSITLQLGSSAWNNATVIVILHILNVVCKRCENWKALDERMEQFCWNLSDSGEDYHSQSRRMVSLSVNTEILASYVFFIKSNSLISWSIRQNCFSLQRHISFVVKLSCPPPFALRVNLYAWADMSATK